MARLSLAKCSISTLNGEKPALTLAETPNYGRVMCKRKGRARLNPCRLRRKGRKMCKSGMRNIIHGALRLSCFMTADEHLWVLTTDY